MSDKSTWNSFLYRACCVAACLFFVSLVSQPGAYLAQSESNKPDKVNVAEGKDFRVKVDTVQPQRTEDGDLLYLLNYSYEFKGRQTVSIKGIGELPAKGKLQHLFSEEILEFIDSDGQLLAVVQLKPNKKQPEGGALEMPKDSEFDQFLSDSTRAQTMFLPKTMQTLNKWFPSGYTIRQEGQVTSFVTGYRNVDGLPSHLRGEVAVRVSFPYDPSSDQFFFRIYLSPRQYPKKSETPEAPSADTRKVFEAFGQRLLQELKQ